MRRFHELWVWLVEPPKPEQSGLEIVSWWERRRLTYNLLVGSVALVCLPGFWLALNSSGVLKAGEDAVEPLALVFAPIAINIGYCAGWVGESIL